MKLLLDTSILVELERGNHIVQHKIKEICGDSPGSLFISFITFFEFKFGMEGLSDNEKLDLTKFLWKFSVLHSSNEAMSLASLLKSKYSKLGKQKSLTDIFIASQALENNLILVTKDKDFDDISEIKKVIL